MPTTANEVDINKQTLPKFSIDVVELEIFLLSNKMYNMTKKKIRSKLIRRKIKKSKNIVASQ